MGISRIPAYEVTAHGAGASSSITESSRKKVLLIKCLKDDEDGSMEGLAAVLKEKKEAGGHIVTVVDLNTYEKLYATSAHHFTEVCFVGHSRFVDPKGRVIKVIDRTIGGFGIERVITIMINALFKNKASSFKFYCCETATSIASSIIRDTWKPKRCIAFDSDAAVRVRSFLSMDADGLVSTVAYVSLCIRNLLKKIHDSRTIKIQGLNGYGYFKGRHPKTLSFDRAHLGEMHHILMEETRNREHADALEETFVAHRIVNKGSAYKIQFLVSNS